MQFKVRSQQGFSIATVLALGVTASIWIMATASIVVPSAARLSTDRTSELARCSAEAALDYTLQQLNNPTTRSATLNAGTVTVPASVMADYNALSSPPTHLTASVTLQNLRPPLNGQSGSVYTSYLYDATVDDQNPTSALYGNGNDNNMWRVATAVVTNGVISRAVRVILKPVLDSTSVTTSGQVSGTPIPIFQYGAFGVSGIGGTGNTTLNSYDSSVNPNPTSFDTLASAFPHNSYSQDLATPGYGDLASDGNASFTGNANLGGNLVLFGGANTAAGGPNFMVDGAVQATNPTGSLLTSPNDIRTPSTSQTFPPTPPQPASPTALPGGASAIDLSGRATMTLSSGNYVVNYISITSLAQLIVEPTAGPINIWVSGSSSTGVNIMGQGISNASGMASNLRIWYNGSQAVQVAGNGNFTGTIFAPNAPVTISGNGNVFGSVFGNVVNLNGNGAFHFDRALLHTGGLTWTPLVTVTTTTIDQYLNNFQAVSWHEFNPNSQF